MSVRIPVRNEEAPLEVEYISADDVGLKSMPSNMDYLLDDPGSYWHQEIKALLDMYVLKHMLVNDPWVFIVASFVARKLSNLPMSVHRNAIIGGKMVKVPVASHHLNDMIMEPSEFEGYCNFIYRILMELCAMGNAIIWKMRFSDQLILIPTESVTLDFDSKGNLESYIVNAFPMVDNEPALNQSFTIHKDDVIHIKLPNPNSVLWGLSPFIPGRKNVLFDRYSQEYLLDFYVNKAKPGAVVELSKEANEKQAVRFLKSLEAKWEGRASQQRTLLLPQGASLKTVAHKLSEQELQDHLEDNKNTIKAFFSIPPHAFGTQKTGSIGSDETKQQMKAFWENTGKPFGDLVAEAFTKGFSKELRARYCFAFNYESVPFLKEDEKDKIERANLRLQTHTLNEVRRMEFALPSLEGGDALPGQTTFQNFQGIPTQDPPQIVNNLSTEPMKLGQTPESKRLREFLKRKDGFFTHKKSNSDEAQLRKQETEALAGVLSWFEKTLPMVQSVVKQGLKGRVDVKGVVGQRTKGLEDDIKRSLLEGFKQFEPEYEDFLTPIQVRSEEAGYNIALDTPFGMPQQDEFELLRTEDQEGVRSTLKARGLESFEGITETTTNEILDSIGFDTLQNSTIDQIADNIRKYYGEKVPGRARTIARTETLIASSIGQENLFKSAKKILGDGVRKMWVTVGDDRVRESHIALDGTEPNSKGKFANGLRYPRDSRGPAEEIINCRCTTLIIPPEESLDVDLPEGLREADLLQGQEDTRPDR